MEITIKYKNLGIIAIIATMLIYSCNDKEEKKETTDMEDSNMTKNVLLNEWEGPYGGVPAFDKMKVEDIKPALEEAMEVNLNEIEEIANNDEPATFENTIVAMEKSGEELNRVFTYYGIYSSNMSSPEFREVQQEMAPKLSEFQSKISQNEKLFQRIKTVYEASKKDSLEADQQRVVQLTYEQFAMNGAELDEEKKKRYAEINKELSELYTTFSNNVLADEEGYVTYINKEQLGALSEPLVKAYAKAAADRGKDGQYAITNTRS